MQTGSSLHECNKEQKILQACFFFLDHLANREGDCVGKQLDSPLCVCMWPASFMCTHQLLGKMQLNPGVGIHLLSAHQN